MNPKWWIMALLAAGCNADVGGTTAYVALIGGSCTYPAKRMAAEIFQKAGVTIIWGSPKEAASRPGWLRVRIVEQAPEDNDARLALAQWLMAQSRWAEAMDELLVIASRDRRFGDDIARRMMLAIFELCPDTALVSSYRRRLSASLY